MLERKQDMGFLTKVETAESPAPAGRDQESDSLATREVLPPETPSQTAESKTSEETSRDQALKKVCGEGSQK